MDNAICRYDELGRIVVNSRLVLHRAGDSAKAPRYRTVVKDLYCIGVTASWRHRNRNRSTAALMCSWEASLAGNPVAVNRTLTCVAGLAPLRSRALSGHADKRRASR